MIAENDHALGRFVEAISKSRYWKDTAIFVLEDDAQNGPDHVDAHRSLGYIISPYTQRKGAVDSTLYTTSGFLRTMELILGLEPLSQYDAAATPAYNAFSLVPNTAPYAAVPPKIDIMEMNDPKAWGAQASAEMDLAEADRAPDLLLNEIVWRSVRGPNSKMPPPVRAAWLKRGVTDATMMTTTTKPRKRRNRFGRLHPGTRRPTFMTRTGRSPHRLAVAFAALTALAATSVAAQPAASTTAPKPTLALVGGQVIDGYENNLGTLAKGRLADVIAVRGDAPSTITLLQSVNLVIQGGKRVK